MSDAPLRTTLAPLPALDLRHAADLAAAVAALEQPSLAIKLADAAGQPLAKLMRFVPRAATAPMRRSLEAAILRCLKIAIESLEERALKRPSNWAPKLLAGASGGLGGLFGFVALPVELPVTTLVMLRAIADIARHEGEDLSRLDSRMACLEVFALGSDRTSGPPRRDPAAPVEYGYFASRMMMAKLTRDAMSLVVERGALDATAPAIGRFVTEVAARFGIAVSERAAATAIPVIGAVSGATVNLIFTDHFQRVARGHFVVRRLERAYGPELVRRSYDALRSRADASALA